MVVVDALIDDGNIEVLKAVVNDQTAAHRGRACSNREENISEIGLQTKETHLTTIRFF